MARAAAAGAMAAGSPPPQAVQKAPMTARSAARGKALRILIKIRLGPPFYQGLGEFPVRVANGA
jgi:hypothetical protein